MRLYAGGFAVLAPGLDGWEAAREVLAGRRPYVPADLVPPSPGSLPPNERRRASAAVRLAVAAAEAAVAASRLPATDLASVFGSSNGDGAVVGSVLGALSVPRPAVSPTAFHNSVHNTPAAYWAIGSGCRRPSTSLGCHDDTFAAALLRAASQAAAGDHPVLLCVYDAPFPPPLAAVRPTPLPFAVAMVLTPEPVPTSEARLDLRLVPEPPPGPALPRGESLRPLYGTNPAARSLRLLEAVAGRESGPVLLAYLGDSHLRIDVAPC